MAQGHPVLLDIDGTLVDSNDAHAHAWSDALRAYGYTFPAQEILPLIGMGGEKIMATLVPGLAPNDGRLGQKIAEHRGRIFLAEYVAKLKPTHGARDLLLELRSWGCALIVASSAKSNELTALLRTAGLADLIEAAATADDAERSKPEPDIVEAALIKAGVPPNTAVMIGDTPYDIAAAHAAGVRIIAVRCGGWGDKDLGKADAIYEDPADILANINEPALRRMFPTPPKTAPAQH